MGGMTDTPEAPERVALHYTGSQPIRLAENAHSVPYIIEPDSTVIVDEWAATILVQGEAFKPAGGRALDGALRDAGLPTGGSADEKRARLADHEAALIPTTEQEAPRG